MKKNESQLSTKIKKGSVFLNISFAQSPQISTMAHTSLFPFECFGDELHIPTLPIFGYNTTGKWYTHIPIIVILTVSNRKPQEMHDLMLTLKVYNKKNKIMTLNESMPETVVPGNGLYTHKFKITIDDDNIIDINFKAECKCKIDNLKYKATCSDKLIVDVPLGVVFRFCGSDRNILQVDVENRMSDEIASNIRLKVGDKGTIPLIKKLNYTEKVSGNMILDSTIKEFDVIWDVIGAKDNKKKVKVDFNLTTKNMPFTVVLETPSKPLKSLEPFKIKLIITNIINSPIEGEVLFKQSYTSLQLFGINESLFKSIDSSEKVEMEFCFVALNHGTYKIPSITFDLQKPLEKIEFVPKEVVIVLGNTN